jgi:sugar lactone lactonase YvrE
MKHKTLLGNAIVILLPFAFHSCTKGPVEATIAATVTTLAGSGIEGWVDGSAATAQFNSLFFVAVDGQGNVFTTDTKKYCVRRIAPDGTVTTIAGGSQGTADGAGASAQFMKPGHIVADKQGNLYVADESRIRKITPSGVVTTFAGSVTAGSVDGIGTAAQFNTVGSLAMNSAGVLYVVDHDYTNIKTRIRKINPSSEVTTFMDSSILFLLDEIVVDKNNNLSAIFSGLYFNSATIQKITPSKSMTQIAAINGATSMAIGSLGELYITATTTWFTSSNCDIYKLTSNGKYVSIAGGEAGFADGEGASARFFHPNGIAVDADGKIYISDAGNLRIRKITLH